jgi:hypothetical protein
MAVIVSVAPVCIEIWKFGGGVGRELLFFIHIPSGIGSGRLNIASSYCLFLISLSFGSTVKKKLE